MSSYFLGYQHGTRIPAKIPRAAYDTHWHLIGGTGKGKTTALHRMLHELLLDPTHEPCVFIVDRMGNLSQELLLWVTSDYCTEDVRRRVVYIEPSREDVVLGFNPLLFQTEGHAYYKVSRAAEIILRGWASQNLDEMPRLARWLFNSFYACALLGLTIAGTVHLLLPGSPHHRQILECLPLRLKVEWAELINSRTAEVTRTLESARNRLKPFYESPLLRNMFGATENRLDVARFMREGSIVVLNLAPNNRLPEQVADAVGGLVLNEILTTARSLPPGLRYPTYPFLDEFQRFVGGDIESAIPEVRQLGIKLILSHQSFSQLVRGDIDLTSIIFQCQSRMIFGVQGEDADLLAHELASLQFDPHKIKDQLFSRRQRLTGHKVVELSSWSESQSHAQNWMQSNGQDWGNRHAIARPTIGYGEPVYTDGTTDGRSQSTGTGGGISAGSSRSTGQTLVPVHEDYEELMNRTYVTFQEDRGVWARDIRRLPRGTAFLRLVDDEKLRHVDIKRSAPGHLSWDWETLAREFPEAIDALERFKEENFRNEIFVSPQVIEAETRERLDRVTRGVVGHITDARQPPDVLDGHASQSAPESPATPEKPDLFA